MLLLLLVAAAAAAASLCKAVGGVLQVQLMGLMRSTPDDDWLSGKV